MRAAHRRGGSRARAAVCSQARWYEYSRQPPQGLPPQHDGVGRGDIPTYAIGLFSLSRESRLLMTARAPQKRVELDAISELVGRWVCGPRTTRRIKLYSRSRQQKDTQALPPFATGSRPVRRDVPRLRAVVPRDVRNVGLSRQAQRRSRQVAGGSGRRAGKRTGGASTGVFLLSRISRSHAAGCGFSSGCPLGMLRYWPTVMPAGRASSLPVV